MRNQLTWKYLIDLWFGNPVRAVVGWFRLRWCLTVAAWKGELVTTPQMPVEPIIAPMPNGIYNWDGHELRYEPDRPE